MKRAIKWFLASIALLVLLYTSIFIFGVIASHETGKRWGIGYGASTSTRPVKLEIGDRIFSIPQNHIWSRDRWSGGKVSGVNMQALLPDFLPYTESTKKQFDRLGVHDKITLLLSRHNTPVSYGTVTRMSRADVYGRIIVDYGTGRARGLVSNDYMYGLDKIDMTPPRVGGKELYVAANGGGSEYWVECSHDGSVPFPSCSTWLEYSERVAIRYTFSRSYLRNWKQIDAAVVSFIKKFDVGSDKGESK